MLEYKTIEGEYFTEWEINKSRFLTYIKHVETEIEAQEFISSIKKKHFDARHNCSAYIIGERSEIQKSSDDGEPSGTAGAPMLEVLKKNELSDIVVVVTRYFGGIKLGAGGLIRAYSNSVTNVVEKVGVIKRVLQQELIFSVPYNRFDEVDHYLKQQKIFIANTEYGVDVKIHIFVNDDQQAKPKEDLTNLLAGQVTFTNGEKRYNEIPVEANNYHEQ